MADWPSCTPLEDYHPNDFLEELSSSGLDDETLAAKISEVLGEKLSVDEIRQLSFASRRLTTDQLTTLAHLLDHVSSVYLYHVKLAEV
jgi:hypothetical protein